MECVVVYETLWGNTRMVAQAIAEGLGAADVIGVHDATEQISSAEMLVLGGPTHVRGIARSATLRMAIQAASEPANKPLYPQALEGPGLRRLLRDIAPGGGRPALAFDTRLDRHRLITGSAARVIARRLRRRGYDVIASESFLVRTSQGPLKDGELERAREWGRAHAAAFEPGPGG